MPDADGPRDLMLEAFVIARRDRTFSEDVARILQQEANALSELVDGGKGSGLIKQSLSTDAIVLFCQALEIGTYLAVNVDDEHRRTPSVDEWKTFVTCFLESLAPDQPSESPNAN
ncbi:hypothetical protein [Candidatus Poriferisodalis sp.]|uniref:hypothetical protein n=1 Tax=Candidatus Poriferisodalis sp. TaxID=3101277 RepID=UPI003B51F9FB